MPLQFDGEVFKRIGVGTQAADGGFVLVKKIAMVLLILTKNLVTCKQKKIKMRKSSYSHCYWETFFTRISIFQSLINFTISDITRPFYHSDCIFVNILYVHFFYTRD